MIWSFFQNHCIFLHYTFQVTYVRIQILSPMAGHLEIIVPWAFLWITCVTLDTDWLEISVAFACLPCNGVDSSPHAKVNGGSIIALWCYGHQQDFVQKFSWNRKMGEPKMDPVWPSEAGCLENAWQGLNVTMSIAIFFSDTCMTREMGMVC